jgi:hypothetical protein
LSGSNSSIKMVFMAQRGTIAGIDLAELEKLCGLQCTDEEIAAWFGVATRTIERRRRVRKFADVMDRGKAKGRISLRRQQMKLLESGSASMGIWLGKQILGQTDEIRHEISGAFISVCLPREPLIPTLGIEVGSVSGRPLIEASGRDSECDD